MTFISQPAISLSDGPIRDAFGKLRISAPFSLFDSKQIYSDQPLLWDTETTGTGGSVHSVANATSTLSVGASAGDFAIRQTFKRFVYQSGKSQLALFTGTLSTEANVTKRIGLIESDTTTPFDPTSGLYFENNGTNIGVVINKGGSATRVAQSSWNVDPMDGNGPSGVTLDLDQAHIFVIDFEWLGVGRVRWGFDIGGSVIYVHDSFHANIVDSTYVGNPNFPIRYEIRSTGGAGSMSQICSTVISEGGFDPAGAIVSVTTGISDAIDCGTAGTEYLIAAFRQQDARPGIIVSPLRISIVTTTNTAFRWTVRFNPTIANQSFADLADSSLQTMTGDTVNDPSNTTVTGGTIIFAGYASNDVDSADVELDPILQVGKALDGTRDIISLSVSFNSNNEDAFGSFTWREQI